MSNDKSVGSTRIFLVEDHPVMRLGLKMMLLEHGYEVCGEANCENDAIQHLQETSPQVVIVDLSLNGETAFSTLSKMRKILPSALLIVYSMHDSPLYVENALKMGVNGYVTKSDPVETLITAIEETKAGKKYLGPTLTKNLEERHSPLENFAQILKDLSEREVEVLTHLGNGFGCAEIANQLTLSSRTIETYISRLKSKLGVTNNRELIKEAIRIIHPH